MAFGDYDARRATAMNRLHELVAARRNWDQYQNHLMMEDYKRQEAMVLEQEKEAQAAEVADKKNWLNEASEGFKMGSTMGPIGAWVGAAAGALYGQKQAYDQRRSEGQGKWDAFKGTHFDTPMGANKGTRENMANFGGGAANLYNQKQKEDARKSTAIENGGTTYTGDPNREYKYGGTSMGEGGMVDSYPNQKLGGINGPQETSRYKGWGDETDPNNPYHRPYSG